MVAGRERILITGGGTFVGNHIAAALLAEGASVSLLVRSGAEDRLGQLAQETDWREGDVWNPPSLKGRGRQAKTVIHTVGGLKDDPATGLTFHYLNVLSLRNVADMCISDGVRHLIFISAAGALWFPRPYIRSKREAEAYMERVGVRGTIIRPPLLYQRGKPRPFIYKLVNLTANLSPTFRRSAPMPVDVFARAVARIAIADGGAKPRYYARDLWRMNTREERRGTPKAAKSTDIDDPALTDHDTRPNVPIS